MSGARVLMVMLSGVVALTAGQLNIDLSKAALDPDTGNFCVVQKVCITNPPESLTASGCAPMLRDGCQCFPGEPADEYCKRGETCADNCQCLRAGCDCDPDSQDPDSFCGSGQVCKDTCECGAALPPGCECDPYSMNPDGMCMTGQVCQDCKCMNPLPAGCDCNPYAADPDSFCPMDQICKDCKCKTPLPAGCDCDPYDPDTSCPSGQQCKSCVCLPAGCDCDPMHPDPDSFCPLDQVCKDCMCDDPLPPGCNCDPNDPNPGNYCPAGQICKNCMCDYPLPAGCNCDPRDADPDSSCMAGQVCQDCICEYPLAPGCMCDERHPCPSGKVCKDDCSCGAPLPAGCDCDPDLPNADAQCPGEARCVGCMCNNCPASDQVGSSKAINPPLVFVIDTTKSVKPDKDSIFNLTMKVVENIMKDNINIPRYQLVSFNDFGPRLTKNVKIELDTTDVREFGRKAASLKFESYNGGRDSKERLTQGLLVALQNAMPKSLVVVFTDNGSKNLDLEKQIIKLRDEKECEVFIVLTPEYEGKKNGKSLPVYNRLGKVFLISDVGADQFLGSVEEYEETNCI